MSRRRPHAILLDAYGTLVELDDPVGRLRSALADAGFAVAAEAVAAGFAAEVRFYRANHDRGRDDASLRSLRRDCAAVFAAALPITPPGDVAEAVLVEGLRYRSFDDVVPALDALAAGGCALAVVSNWDASLPAVLHQVGLLDRFAVVSASAVVGSRKPDSAMFRHAVQALGVARGDAIHVGDDAVRDCVGAANAGVRAVLLDRLALGLNAPCPRIETLTDLLDLV